MNTRTSRFGSRSWTGSWAVVPIVSLGLALSFAPPSRAQEGFATLAGTTGLINTPTAQVLPEAVRFGYMFTDKEWSYQDRGTLDSEVYFLSFGFLPRIEVLFRATAFPQPEGRGGSFTVDRSVSGRLLVLEEGQIRPAIAAGADDPRGTRRFHALYLVGTKSLIRTEENSALRISAGYASTALDARQHVLGGWFGGAEFVYADFLSGALEHDTEKWNTSVRARLFRHLAAQFALLNFETPSWGVSWIQKF